MEINPHNMLWLPLTQKRRERISNIHLNFTKEGYRVTYPLFKDFSNLDKYYNESRVYLQLSRHEAFGISAVEALMGGCQPIVSNCYALPEIIGDSGYIVKECIVDETVDYINTIFSSEYNLLKPTSISIRRFSFEERKKSFMSIL